MSKTVLRVTALIIVGTAATPWYWPSHLNGSWNGVPYWALAAVGVTALAAALLIKILLDERP